MILARGNFHIMCILIHYDYAVMGVVLGVSIVPDHAKLHQERERQLATLRSSDNVQVQSQVELMNCL